MTEIRSRQGIHVFLEIDSFLELSNQTFKISGFNVLGIISSKRHENE